jgi:GTP cyclohydrolase II
LRLRGPARAGPARNRRRGSRRGRVPARSRGPRHRPSSCSAYALQEEGLDTVDANTAQRLPVDSRNYGTGTQILADLGVRRIRLITNNPAKYGGLAGHGLEIVGRVALPTALNPHNIRYLRTKQERMGHRCDVTLHAL